MCSKGLGRDSERLSNVPSLEISQISALGQPHASLTPQQIQAKYSPFRTPNLEGTSRTASRGRGALGRRCETVEAEVKASDRSVAWRKTDDVRVRMGMGGNRVVV